MLRRLYLGLNLKITIAIHMCIDDRGGALGRQGPVGSPYRHRMLIVGYTQIIRIQADRSIDLRLCWGIDMSRLSTLSGLPSRAILRTTFNSRHKFRHSAPYVPETLLDGVPIPAVGMFHFLKFRSLPQSQRAHHRLDYRSRLEDVGFALNDINIGRGIREFLELRQALRARMDDQNPPRLVPCRQPEADQGTGTAERQRKGDNDTQVSPDAREQCARRHPIRERLMEVAT